MPLFRIWYLGYWSEKGYVIKSLGYISLFSLGQGIYFACSACQGKCMDFWWPASLGQGIKIVPNACQEQGI